MIDPFAERIAHSGVQEDASLAQNTCVPVDDGRDVQHGHWLDTTGTSGELELGECSMENDPVD